MNFKSLREDKLKLSQDQFAELYDVSVEKVQAWDKNCEDISFKILEKIAQNTGMTLNEVTGYEKPVLKAFDAEYTWEKADFTKKSLIGYIRQSLERMGVTEEQKKNYIDDFEMGIEANFIKPSISIVGRSDTGKSTLINSLIGMEKMPTSWTPTTAIAIYIKHIKERPDFIKEDAWVFSDSVDGENLWNAKMLCDEEYCKKWKIAAGEIDILRKYGTRQGGGLSNHAGSAVVFIDAPILLNCDIVDLPGFGTETGSDDEITLNVAKETDILIYLSQANGFMRIEDITYLKENVRNLPVWEKKGDNDLKPLANLFVVASQAHTVCQGNEIELNNILAKGYENFAKTLSKEYWRRRKELSGYDYLNKEIRSRFFTYTTDIPVLCERFTIELKKILELLPDIISKKTKKFIHDYVVNRKPNLEAEIEKYEKMLGDRDKYLQLLREIDSSELERSQNNDENKSKIKDKIKSLCKDSVNEYADYVSSLINTDAIAIKIKNKGIKNKKEEIECFASELQDEMQNECNELLEKKSQELANSIKNYIKQYENNIQIIFNSVDAKIDFDAGFAFASALSKIGIIGGLGVYVAGEAAFWFGSMTLIAGVVSHLPWGAMTLINLGPIGIAVGLALAAGIGVIKLFGGGWEKSVAKKLVKSYEENNVIDQYRNAIYDYWEKTENAFDKAAFKLDEEWNSYVSILRQTVEEYDVDKINENLVTLKNIMNFFGNIPL